MHAGLYDASDSERFFVSISYFSCRSAKCLSVGPVPVFSYLLIGVSKTSDPRDGFLGPYFVATDAINPETDQVSRTLVSKLPPDTSMLRPKMSAPHQHKEIHNSHMLQVAFPVLQPYPGFGDCGQAPPGFTGKGCLGDYPNPGMDKNAFWWVPNPEIITIMLNTCLLLLL